MDATEYAMSKDFAETMQTLDDAEQLLAACSVRGIVSDFESHMEINRRIIEEARRQLGEVTA